MTPLTNASENRGAEQALHKDFTPAELGFDVTPQIPLGGSVLTNVVDVSGFPHGDLYLLASQIVDVDAISRDETNSIDLTLVNKVAGLAAATWHKVLIAGDVSIGFTILAVRFIRFRIVNQGPAASDLTLRYFART